MCCCAHAVCRRRRRCKLTDAHTHTLTYVTQHERVVRNPSLRVLCLVPRLGTHRTFFCARTLSHDNTRNQHDTQKHTWPLTDLTPLTSCQKALDDGRPFPLLLTTTSSLFYDFALFFGRRRATKAVAASFLRACAVKRYMPFSNIMWCV